MDVRTVVAATVVALVGAARPAAAEVSSARTPVVVMDCAAGSLILGAFATRSLIPAYSGLALYQVGSPVAHAIAGDGMTGSSFGRRLVFPLGAGLAGTLIGFALDAEECNRDSDCGGFALFGAGLGFLAGGLVASVIDYRDASDLSSGEPEPMMFTYGGGF